jgi:hypothetical protein
MLATQAFIAEKGWDALKTELNIRQNRVGDLVVLNYDQVFSPKNHPVTNECRSLILHYPSGRVVSRAFDRFFNDGEIVETPELDFETGIIVQEKLDGSLVKLYNYEGTWFLSTRSVADAVCPQQSGGTFKDAIMRAGRIRLLQETQLDPKWTYIFEYIGPENQVVCRYPESKLVLIGCRRNVAPYDEKTFQELDELHYKIRDMGWNVTRPLLYLYSSIQEVEAHFETCEPTFEGFVALDPRTGHRTKIKNPAYKRFTNYRFNVPDDKIMELVCLGEDAEYVAVFPDVFCVTVYYLGNAKRERQLMTDAASDASFSVASSALHATKCRHVCLLGGRHRQLWRRPRARAAHAARRTQTMAAACAGTFGLCSPACAAPLTHGHHRTVAYAERASVRTVYQLR